MWSWIRKNIFRIYRGGKHRTDGLSTFEKAAFQKEPVRTVPEYARQAPINHAAVAAALKSPVMHVPVVPGKPRHAAASEVARATEISMTADTIPSVAARQDYVPTSVLDETRISPQDWTTDTSTW